MVGSSAGANAMYSAWSRWRASSALPLARAFGLRPTACEVPVLPAEVYAAPANTRVPVPPLVTATIASRTTSTCLRA
ncbi:hypothetical protein D3C86_1463120 [compost metagenome]